MMVITRIDIHGFRLLKDFSLNLEDELSLIIGKNNSGKTSVLTALDKFLNTSEKNKIVSDDFNVDLKKELVALINDQKKIVSEDEYIPLGITLQLFIEYSDRDDLSQVSPLIMSLDPSDKNIVLSFEYVISHMRLQAMKEAFQSEQDKYDNDASLFLKEKISYFFEPIKKKSLLFDDSSVYTDLVQENINLADVLAFQYISAKRSVTNKDNDKTLSSQTSQIYKKTSESVEQELVVDEFKQKLRETDKELGTIYANMFEPVLKKVKDFGGLRKNDSVIKVASTLQHRELLDGNTTVLYSHGDHELPESFNGLGYMNLISMIFEIEVLMRKFRRTSEENPAALNLLFIEEPEAHTHPQMQYIFIKNIKSLLKQSQKREDGIEIQLQTVVSTHSSHIVSECDFNDVKYLKKDTEQNSVESKNLKFLQGEFSSGYPEKDAVHKQNYKFLKQYLTLNKAELFFADKAILIEGDTERVLIPAMMKKMDQEFPIEDTANLLSQNISIVEVGAHSQIFEKFIDFIGIKTLIVTDIDSYFEQVKYADDGVTEKRYKNGNPVMEVIPCEPNDSEATKTSNNSLLFFHNKTRADLQYFLGLPKDEKTLLKADGVWSPNENGHLFLAYQTEVDGYHARSFEDAFFSINKGLLGTDSSAFPSLTKCWFEEYIDDEINHFEFSEKAVGSKPSLAIEILLNSKEVDGKDFSNWQIPQYIQEGLEWLRKE